MTRPLSCLSGGHPPGRPCRRSCRTTSRPGHALSRVYQDRNHQHRRSVSGDRPDDRRNCHRSGGADAARMPAGSYASDSQPAAGSVRGVKADLTCANTELRIAPASSPLYICLAGRKEQQKWGPINRNTRPGFPPPSRVFTSRSTFSADHLAYRCPSRLMSHFRYCRCIGHGNCNYVLDQGRADPLQMLSQLAQIPLDPYQSCTEP